MSYLSERISYLKGLAEGLNIDRETREGRFMLALVSVMDDMADVLDEMEGQNAELLDAIEDLQGTGYRFRTDDALDDDDGQDGSDIYEEFVALECPECGEVVYFDQSMLHSENDLICPECNAPIVTNVAETEDDEEDED